MGRATYLDMAQYWPTAAGSANVHEAEIAAIMNNTPKVGFSRTLQAVPGARIASGDAAEEITRLKQEPGEEIVAHGGARFARSVARLELAHRALRRSPRGQRHSPRMGTAAGRRLRLLGHRTRLTLARTRRVVCQ